MKPVCFDIKPCWNHHDSDTKSGASKMSLFWIIFLDGCCCVDILHSRSFDFIFRNLPEGFLTDEEITVFTQTLCVPQAMSPFSMHRFADFRKQASNLPTDIN